MWARTALAASRQSFYWRLRHAGALAIIISFLGCTGATKLVAGINEPEIGITPPPFEHVTIFNPSKNVYSGASASDRAPLFTGDVKIMVKVEAKTWSHRSNAVGRPDTQIIWNWDGINFNVVRKCTVLDSLSVYERFQ